MFCAVIYLCPYRRSRQTAAVLAVNAGIRLPSKLHVPTCFGAGRQRSPINKGTAQCRASRLVSWQAGNLSCLVLVLFACNVRNVRSYHNLRVLSVLSIRLVKPSPLDKMAPTLPPNAHVSAHPCVRAKLSQLRSASTNARDTKALVHDIATIVGCEAFAHGLTAAEVGKVSASQFNQPGPADSLGRPKRA